MSAGLKKKCHGFRAEAKQRAWREKFKAVLFLNVMGNAGTKIIIIIIIKS